MGINVFSKETILNAAKRPYVMIDIPVANILLDLIIVVISVRIEGGQAPQPPPYLFSQTFPFYSRRK